MSKFDLYQHVTDEFIKAIETDGELIWDKPWKGGGGSIGQQINLNSKRPYRGFVNQMLLILSGYNSPYWMTFNGARELAYKEWCRANGVKIEKLDLQTLKEKGRPNTENTDAFFAAGGGGVKKGEKGTLVVFWKVIPNKRYVKDSTDPATMNKNIFMLRYYKVFNLDQTSGITVKNVQVDDDPEDLGELFPHLPATFLNQDSSGFSPIVSAQKLWDGYEDKPSFKLNGGRATYTPSTDHMEIPDPSLFRVNEEYYSTLFHEAVHSTGHESRLSRPGVTKLDRFGSEKYSKEELVAEMGAAMLCAHAGIEKATLDNSKAYVKGWVKKLKDDKKLIISASGQAQKAVDHILGTELPGFDTEDGAE